MAADSQSTDDEIPHRCEKIYRIRNLLVGAAGDAGPCLSFVRYFRGEEISPEELKGATALVLCPRRGILIYEQTSEPDPVLEEFFAIGCGAHVALGAMHMGASAVEAVEAACRWNVQCGPPVVSLSLNSRRRRAAH